MSPRLSRSKVSHERWLVSYADFITLLFAFFVVLYAFAKADEKKQHQVSAAIDSGFQSLSIAPSKFTSPSAALQLPSSSRVRTGGDLLSSSAKVRADLETMRRDLLRRLSSQITNGTVAVELSREGLVISLREAGFFDSGTAISRPETTGALQQIAESLSGTPYDLRIEGHTDDVPIHNSAFDSNWELSSARATRIARLLLQMHAVPAEQLSAAGYAEYHPIATNNTAQGRAENRRVDLVVTPRTVLDISGNENAQDQLGWHKIAEQ